MMKPGFSSAGFSGWVSVLARTNYHNLKLALPGLCGFSENCVEFKFCFRCAIVFKLSQDDRARAALRHQAKPRAALAARCSAAYAGGLKRRASGRAASYDGSWRSAKRDWLRSFRAEILRVRAPVECLIAKRHAQVARAAEKMHVGLVECGRRVGFREIKNAAIDRGIVRDGQIENSVRRSDLQAPDCRGRGNRA